MIIINNFYDTITNSKKAFIISDEFTNSIREVSLVDNKNIVDGLYIINRGNGWVTGSNDDIVTQTVGAVGPTTITLDYEVEYQEKIIIETKASVGFNIGFIKAMIELTLEVSNTVKHTTVYNYTKTIPNGKSGFGLLYFHYNRYDIVRIKNKKIIDHAIDYSITGVHPIFVEYDTGKSINKKNYRYNQAFCLFNPQNKKIQLPDLPDKIEDAKLVTFPLSYKTKKYSDLPEYVYVYFRPISSGTYKISTENDSKFYLYLSDFQKRNEIKLIGACNMPDFNGGAMYVDLNTNNLYLIRIRTKIYGELGIKSFFSQAMFNITRIAETAKKISPIIMYNLGNDHTVSGVSLLFHNRTIASKIAFKFNNQFGIKSTYIYSRNAIYTASLYEIINSTTESIKFIGDYDVNSNYTYLNCKSNASYIIVLSTTIKSYLNDYLHFYLGGSIF